MLKKNNIKLKKVDLDELPQFTKKLQEAFSIAVKEKFGVDDPIPTENDVRSSFGSDGAVTYHVMLDEQYVGGVMLTIDEKTQRNSLDFFFISPEYHSCGLGLATWKVIEEKYPDTAVWETVTPYFEERNIHFYVNKCGFQIIEFFNKHHIDPNMPCPENSSGELAIGTDAFFRFEKVMK